MGKTMAVSLARQGCCDLSLCIRLTVLFGDAASQVKLAILSCSRYYHLLGLTLILSYGAAGTESVRSHVTDHFNNFQLSGVDM
jgi:hypothetical protein